MDQKKFEDFGHVYVQIYDIWTNICSNLWYSCSKLTLKYLTEDNYVYIGVLLLIVMLERRSVLKIGRMSNWIIPFSQMYWFLKQYNLLHWRLDQ